jgi:hypothetical protein
LTGALLVVADQNAGMPTDTEIRNRRIAAVLLLAAAAIGLLAIVDVGPFADETEQDRVREAVERFVAARDGDEFGAVCELMTPDLRRQVQATSGARPGTEPPGCAQVLRARDRAESERREREVEIVDVNVSGNRARAALEEEQGVSRSITLEDIDGKWLVSTFAR